MPHGMTSHQRRKYFLLLCDVTCDWKLVCLNLKNVRSLVPTLPWPFEKMFNAAHHRMLFQKNKNMSLTRIVETKANIFSLLFLLICHCRLSYAAEIWIGNSMHHVARARSGISACQRQAGAICCRAAALSCVNRYRKFWLWATPQRAYIILGNKQCLFSLQATATVASSSGKWPGGKRE